MVRHIARVLLQLACGLTGHRWVPWRECPALSMCAWCGREDIETFKRSFGGE